jgi:signal transduction histidine kinase
VTWLAGLLNGEGTVVEKDSSRELTRLRQREQELERQIQRFQSVLRMTATLNTTLNFERVLDMILDLGAAALQDMGREDASLISALLLFSHDQLQVVAGRGLPYADLRVTLPGHSGVIESILAKGELRVLSDPGRDPELRQMVGLHRCSSAVCIPLIVGLQIYGLVLFAHPDDKYFTAERQELLEAVTNLAVGAIQNASLYRELEMEKERIAEIHEEARKKLARDLHDGPTQSISAIAMRVNFARRLIDRDAKSAADELFRIEELARRTTKEIRQMLFTLRPLALESNGLVAALEQLAGKNSETYGQRVILEADEGVVDDLEVGKQGVVFYVIEEAVTNARKHAEADCITIRLKRNADVLLVEIDDNGRGFDVAAVSDNYEMRGSLGMVNLQERAELLNGLLRINSAKGRGTKISLWVPLTQEAADRLHRPGFAA